MIQRAGTLNPPRVYAFLNSRQHQKRARSLKLFEPHRPVQRLRLESQSRGFSRKSKQLAFSQAAAGRTPGHRRCFMRTQIPGTLPVCIGSLAFVTWAMGLRRQSNLQYRGRFPKEEGILGDSPHFQESPRPPISHQQDSLFIAMGGYPAGPKHHDECHQAFATALESRG